MKLPARQIEPFVKKLPPHIAAVLVYGPDDGLMRERVKTMALQVVSDPNDPFNVSILKGPQIADDPARLHDEAFAQSLMGGRRLVRIEDGRDGLAPALKDYLKAPNPAALVLIEAGELGPRSPLRALFEKVENAAAVPCYVEDERDIAAFARGALEEDGYRIAPDALTWLAGAIAGDRMRARSEIEKLKTYMGDNRQIAAADILAACGGVGEQSLEALVYSTAGGQPQDSLKIFTALMGEGVPVITVLRSLQYHIRRLHLARARADAGEDPAEIIKTLQPPIFFKQQDAFRAQMRRWSLPALERLLQRLAALEAQCKTTGTPAETLCSQALLSIARAAK